MALRIVADIFAAGTIAADTAVVDAGLAAGKVVIDRVRSLRLLNLKHTLRL